MTHTPGPLVQAQACVAAILNEETMPMKDVLDCAGQCLDAITLAQQERTELLEALKGYNLIDYTVLIGDALILNADPRVAKILEQLAAEIQQVRPTATAAIDKAKGKG